MPPASNNASLDTDATVVVRLATVMCAELAFVALFAWIMWQTWAASNGQPPSISGVREGAAGSLAVLLGAGYASVLGIQPQDSAKSATPTGFVALSKSVKDFLVNRLILFLGVFLYLLVGVASCVTYALNEGEAPAILKAVAVGFGGYVVAFIGSAYQRGGVE